MNRRSFIAALMATTTVPAFTLISAKAFGVTSIGAIYATKSLLLQRMFVPDFDDAEIDEQFLANGETLIRLPLAAYVHGGAQFVQAIIGQPTFSGRCAVVNASGDIIDWIIADPELYSDPRGRVVPCDGDGLEIA